MFSHFHQKRERVEKKVIFDPVEALGAANLLVFFHRLLLDKYVSTELEKQHTIFLGHILVVWNGNMLSCSGQITGRRFQDINRLQNTFSSRQVTLLKIATYFFEFHVSSEKWEKNLANANVRRFKILIKSSLNPFASSFNTTLSGRYQRHVNSLDSLGKWFLVRQTNHPSAWLCVRV